MNVTTLKVRDLNEAWWRCIREVLTHGYEYTIDRGSYAGQKRKEFDFMVCQIEYPGTRPLVPVVPEGVPSPTSMEYVEGEYLTYLMTNVKQENELYTYGQDIEEPFLEICRIYRDAGFETNQMTMSIGNSDSIFLEHSQCLRLIDTRVRYGKLHYIVYFRSWDLWGGFPVNLAAIQLMKEMMADAIGVEDGELIAMSKGLHLYDHSFETGKLVAGLTEELRV